MITSEGWEKFQPNRRQKNFRHEKNHKCKMWEKLTTSKNSEKIHSDSWGHKTPRNAIKIFSSLPAPRPPPPGGGGSTGPPPL
jgi:hypothetical protein